jgi:tetratricopeptide (TPR) repeat protein
MMAAVRNLVPEEPITMRRLVAAALLAIPLAAVASCTQQRPIEVLRQGGDYRFEYGEYAAAAPYYEEIVERRPGDWEAQYRLGLVSLHLGEVDRARLALETAYSLKPASTEIADALAEAMYRQGAEDELYAFLRERADASRSTHEYLQLARYAIELGDMDTAKTAALTAIEVDEGRSVEPYLVAAELHARLGDTEEVLRRLRQAYGVNPRHAEVLAKLKEYGEVPGPTIALPPGQ